MSKHWRILHLVNIFTALYLLQLCTEQLGTSAEWPCFCCWPAGCCFVHEVLHMIAGELDRQDLPPGKDKRLPPKGGAALKCLLRAGTSRPFSLVMAPSRSETHKTRPPLTWIISAAHAPTLPNPCTAFCITYRHLLCFVVTPGHCLTVHSFPQELLTGYIPSQPKPSMEHTQNKAVPKTPSTHVWLSLHGLVYLTK